MTGLGRVRVGVAALVVGLAVVPLALVATAGAAGGDTKIKFATASGPPVPFTATCDASGACLLPVSGGPESTVTGDFEGTGVYAGVARLLDPGDGTSEAYSSAEATFTGSVKGCGEGTILIRYDAHYAADLPHGGGGTWEIVDELGTGDLENLTGRGTFTVGEVNLDDLSGTNNFKGRISC